MMHHNDRSSYISNSSSTTYPSTLSSLPPSALGLTDSPSRLDKLVMSTPSTPSSGHPSRLHRASKTHLKSTKSSSALNRQGVVQKLVQDAEERSTPRKQNASLPRGSSNRSSPNVNQGVVSSIEATKHSRISTPSITNSERPKLSTAKSKESVAIRPTPSERMSTRAKEATMPDGRSIAIPRRPKTTSSEAPQASTGRGSSPLKAVRDEWEEELVREAQGLRIASQSADVASHRQREREEKKKRDAEWEKAGRWEDPRDAGREAEDRTRREAGREIAYPPSAPRVPIRAAPSGVTSVHVGVRPRLHPSRSDQSYMSNQPDPNLPQPLFSPLGESHAANLPTEDHVRGSYNQMYTSELADKAKNEYEVWLSKKTEREEGFGGADGYGTRDWEPRSREAARPGWSHKTSGGPAEPSPINVYSTDQTSPVSEIPQTPAETMYQYPFHYPNMIPTDSSYNGNMLYPGYWDPNMYYWAMQHQASGLGEPHPIGVDLEPTSKVRFDTSPERSVNASPDAVEVEIESKATEQDW